jgi:hypothetical protein
MSLASATATLDWLSKLTVRVRVKATLRLAVYRQSVRIGDKPLHTTSNFIFQLNTSGCNPYVTPYLTRGCVCRLQLLLVLVSAIILMSEALGTHDQILLSQIRDYQSGEPDARIPQEQGGQVMPPGSEFPFRRLLRLTWLRWKYSIPPPHGICRMIN